MIYCSNTNSHINKEMKSENVKMKLNQIKNEKIHNDFD